MRDQFTLIILWLVTPLLIFSTTIAQTESPLAYLLQNEQVSQINLLTGEHINIIDLTPLSSIRSDDVTQIDRRLWAADIDPTGQYLYQIEAWGHSANRNILGAPTGAELVRIDLTNNTREGILENKTVFNFVISPNGEKILVFFYGDEYLYSTQLACVLSFDTGNCIPLDYDYVANVGHWIDNEKFIIATNDVNPTRLIDAQTGDSETLVFPSEWQVYVGTSIPNSSVVIVPGQPYENSLPHPISFLTYNLDTQIIQTLPYSAPNTSEYISVNELLVSPDAQYLLYKGEHTALVDFASGELIQEFTSVYSVDWIDNTTLLLHGSIADEAISIMRVDVATGQITTLLEDEEATGLLLFP